MRAALGVIALAVACDNRAPPVGQVALYIDTDAIVPPSDVPALFDTLRIDVIPPDATTPCERCERTFAVTSTDFSRNQVSFGVPLPAGARGWRARVRLYPARATLSGDPPPPLADGTPPASVIESVVELPPVGLEGIVERRVLLSTDDVGTPRGTLDAPAQPEPGRFTRSLVNTWKGAKRIPCATSPADGEACVPGGAYWMGNATARPYLTRYDPPSALDASNLRLVVLSPFFFDMDLVTVARFRASMKTPEAVWSGSTSGDTPDDFCTFTTKPGPFEDYPVNCVAFATAQRYCKSRGGELPTEAQFEYVAGALASRRFAWGEDPIEACDEAVFGRGGWGIYLEKAAPCHPNKPPGGAMVVGSLATSRRDKLVMGASAITDLDGNVRVWTLDLWNRQTEACWSHGGVYLDPVCEGASVDGPLHTVRGSTWLGLSPLPAAYRSYAFDLSENVGVRCARGGL